MADDSVKQARQALKERVLDRIIATTRDVPTLDGLIDALIAAVRAEPVAQRDALQVEVDELRERVDVLERKLADVLPELR